MLNFDWQIIAVAVVLLLASGYVLRRALRRVRSFTSKSGAASCASGCGNCSEVSQTPKPAFVNITRRPIGTTKQR